MTEAAQTPGTYRSTEIGRTGNFTFEAVNARGGRMQMGSGDDELFSPIELFLAALAGCGAIDLEHLTGKRAPFESFAARSEGHKIRDEHGNHLVDLRVTFDVTFPEGEAGDRAREVVPRALQQIETRLCAVGRTVQLGVPVQYIAGPL